MKPDLRKLIIDCSVKQNDLRQLIQEYKNNFGSESAFYQFISNLENSSLYSSEVINLIADSLQIMESKEHLEQFEPEDILGLYKLIHLNNPDNIGYFKDYISFKINVLDQTTGVSEEITNYLLILEDEKNELNSVLHSMS